MLQYAAVGLKLGASLEGEDEMFVPQADELGQVTITGERGGREETHWRYLTTGAVATRRQRSQRAGRVTFPGSPR